MDHPAPEWLTTVVLVQYWLIGFGVLLPFGLGMERWRAHSPAARAVIWYLGFWSVEIFVDLWSRKVLHTNVYLYHVTVLVETWLLGWAYYQVFDLQPIRRVMPWIGALFTWLALVEAFWLTGLHDTNRITRAVQVVLMLTLVLLYFEQWTRKPQATRPRHDALFMTSAGLAVYYAGSVMGYLLQEGDGTLTQRILSLIIDSSYGVSLVLMAIGFWYDQGAKTQLESGEINEQ